jgi:molecular chaperone HtpG
MGTIAARTISQHKLNETVVVGKDVLELLSSAMYVDPLCVYREYIQNAADAIDEAQGEGLYSRNAAPRIDVSIDLLERSIKIRDNGIGVPPNGFAQRLTSLGASKKRGSNARGFRGVGRLSGLAYCQQLIFRTKSRSGSRVWEVRWDCRRLRELLNAPNFAGDLNDIMYEILEFDTFEDSTCSPHFFEVELKKVNRLKSDILLNQAAVESYLAQVGPVPFGNGFSFGKRIMTHLVKHGVGASYNIYLNGNTKGVQRPFRNTFEAKQTVIDRFSHLQTFEIPGVNGGTDAVGWILHHSYYGALPPHLGIKGIRLRVGNIQIGDDKIVESAFPETRFNGWAVGEVHILSSRLVPNGRRDDLEQNVHQQNLINHVTPYAKHISKRCRQKSTERNARKKLRGATRVGPTSKSAERWLATINATGFLEQLPAERRAIYSHVFCLLRQCCDSKGSALKIAQSLLRSLGGRARRRRLKIRK